VGDAWAGHGASCGNDHRVSARLPACGRSRSAPRIGCLDQRTSAVVDEPQSLVIRSCGLAPKPVLTCVFGSQQFSSLHAISGVHVPSMCPASMGQGSRLRRWYMQTVASTCNKAIDGRTWPLPTSVRPEPSKTDYGWSLVHVGGPATPVKPSGCKLRARARSGRPRQVTSGVCDRG
jgi:hypothetical protein